MRIVDENYELICEDDLETNPSIATEDVLRRISLMATAHQYIQGELREARCQINKLKKENDRLYMERDFHRNQADQLRVAYDQLRKNPFVLFLNQFKLFRGKN